MKATHSILKGLMAVATATLCACGGGGGSSAAPTVPPIVLPNMPPVAHVVAALETEVGVALSLDGRGSQDFDGDELTYTWTLVSKPAASTAVVSSGTAVQATFTPDAGGDYVFALTVSDGKSVSAAVEATFTAYTTLQGVQPQQSVLTKERSPYRLAADINISRDASFVVQPGVTILGQGKTLKTLGAVEIQGSAAEPVTLSNLTIVRQGEALGSNDTTNCHVSIAWANVTGGSVYTSGSVFAVCPLSLTDSRLTGTDAIVINNGWGAFNIERNVFDKSAGLSFEVGRAPYVSSIAVRNNRFVDWVGDFAIRQVGMGYGNAVVRNNSFLTPARVAVVVEQTAMGGGYLDASFNYWGTVDLAAIEAMTRAPNPQALTVTPALPAPDQATP